jgi:iron complex outermembrane recepter protein
MLSERGARACFPSRLLPKPTRLIMQTQPIPSPCPRRHSWRGVAAGLASVLLAVPAHAQTVNPRSPTSPAAPRPAETEDVVRMDEFVVTSGFRGSLAAAAEMKERIPIIAEVIAAEDIGKLPDVSIAESLARLPGLTTQRINSRAQGIVIRGLTGDFSTGLLNGREQVSTGSGRAVEFDQYPAELLSSVIVYKTTDAALVGQGLAGTIDLRTVRPLSHGRTSAAANFFYEWNDLGKLNPDSKDTGHRYTVSYIDQFNDHKVGVALGYARTKQPGQGEQWSAWGYPDVGGAGTPQVLGGAKPFIRSSELDREGWMGVLEFQPTENFRTAIDIFYSDFAEYQLLRGIEIPLQWSSAQLQPGYTVQDGLITQGTFANVYGVVRNDFVARDADVLALGWNLQFGNPRQHDWTASLDLSHSRIKRQDMVLETYSGFASNQVGTPDTMQVRMGTNRGALFTPLLDYTNASQMRLAGPQGWGGDQVPGGQVGFIKGPRTRDELSQYRFNARRELPGFLDWMDIGVAYTDRSKWEYEMGPDGREGFFLALASGATSAPLPPIIGTTDLSFIGIPGMISYDPVAALNSGIYDLIPNNNPAYVAENWDVSEKVYLGYLQFGLAGRLGAIPFTGRVGSQFVFTDQSSTGLAANGATILPVSGSHDYFDILPSLNLNFELAELKRIRLSIARQLARQTMRNMRAGSTFGFNEALATSTDPYNGPWSGSGGNPALEPWRSNSIDLAYENYFREGMGYWSVSAYYKDLRNYTYDQTVLADYTGFPTGSSIVPAIYQGTRTVPQNAAGGSIRGLELAVSLPGEKLTPALTGFGVIFGGAFVRSSIQPDPNDPATPIPGLSERVLNGTLYYERHGFGARVSARYRSDYRGDIATFGPRGAVYRSLQSETVVDAQISYAFQQGQLRGLTLIAQAYNLTNEPLFAVEGTDTRLVRDYHRYGTTYSIGASYRF